MSTKNVVAPRWARPKEAAQHCGIGLSTLYMLAKNEPTFPAISRPSKRTSLFDLGELDAWLAKRSTANSPLK